MAARRDDRAFQMLIHEIIDVTFDPDPALTDKDRARAIRKLIEYHNSKTPGRKIRCREISS